MKKVQLILALIAVMGLSSAAYALDQYSDDFDGPDFETSGKWSTWGSATFNGSGQYVLAAMATDDGYVADIYQGDGMYRTIGAGDFVMELSVSKVDQQVSGGGWKVFFMKIIDGTIDTGSGGQSMSGTEFIQPNLDTWWNTNTEWGPLGENGSVYVDAEGTGSDFYSYFIGTITDFDMTLTWDEATGEFTLDWSANSDAYSDSWTSDADFSASTANRMELFYVDASPTDDPYYPHSMTVELDSYNLTPEPATIALLGLGGLVLLRRRIY
jgi:hypothetical protein